MEFTDTFSVLEQSAIIAEAKSRKEGGWRYVQTLAVNLDDGVDVIYSYMKDGHLENLKVTNVEKGAHLPSITEEFLAAFVFENEIHDLFGISFDELKIDFLGNFYKVSTEYPMTIISPEKLAERQKQQKIAEAKAQKAKSDGEPKNAEKEDLEAKLANLDPEKAAKVKAAMEAKAKRESAEKAKELEEKLQGMDPEKAAKVRAAMEAKAKKQADAGKGE